MDSPERNVEALTRAILSEAQTEAEQAKADAQSKADVIRQRAQQQAEVERKGILERASQQAERLRGQGIATSQLKARTLELEHREKLLDRVFQTVRQQLPGVQQRKDYGQIAAQLLREAVVQLKAGKAVVRADKITQKIFTNQALEELSRELKAELSLGQPLEQGIGVVVEASDGHLHYDNTLETRLNRLQSGLRSAVYRILMGEKL